MVTRPDWTAAVAVRLARVRILIFINLYINFLSILLIFFLSDVHIIHLELFCSFGGHKTSSD